MTDKKRGRPPLGDGKRIRIAGIYVTPATAAMLDAIGSVDGATRGRVAGRILDGFSDAGRKKDR